MTILEFAKLFPGYRLHLVFCHLNEDGSTEYDPEYSYNDSTDGFEEQMGEYDWLLHMELADPSVTTVKIHKRTRICAIDVEMQ